MAKDRPEVPVCMCRAVLQHLPSIKPGSLKVYVFMCGGHKSEPFLAKVIAHGTGLSIRSVRYALKELRELNLIILMDRVPGQPGKYRVLDAIPDDREHISTNMTPETSQPATDRPEELSCATEARSSASAEGMRTNSIQETSPTVFSSPPLQSERIESAQLPPNVLLFRTNATKFVLKNRYRELDSAEWAKLKTTFPDVTDLLRRVKNLGLQGSLDPTVPLDDYIDRLSMSS